MRLIKIILITLSFLLFFASAFILFEPGNDPTGFFVYLPSIAIINPNNNISLNSNLEIDFITKGTNDLTITSLKGKMEFIELRCNNQILTPVTEKNMIIYKDYHCNDNSIISVKVLSRELNLDFRFGNNIQKAHNKAH